MSKLERTCLELHAKQVLFLLTLQQSCNENKWSSAVGGYKMSDITIEIDKNETEAQRLGRMMNNELVIFETKDNNAEVVA